MTYGLVRVGWWIAKCPTQQVCRRHVKVLVRLEKWRRGGMKQLSRSSHVCLETVEERDSRVVAF